MKTSLLFFVLFSSLLQLVSYAQEFTRLPNGQPSLHYWQQQTEYTVKASLDARNNILRGTGTITYFNNSPDTLTSIVWHLYQNVFRKDSSPRKMEQHSNRAEVISKGIEIESMAINGSVVAPMVDETIMETPLDSPLLPKTTATISVTWNYDIPKDADLRTGSDGKNFGMGQWYPQIAVYDDVRGWNRTQYLGIAEFYTEYGNWNVELTVPKNFILASTGTLTNANEVLSPEQFTRFNALTKDSTTRIILPDEIDSTSDMISADSTIWKFSAENVRDFAWAASPNFVWDGTMTNDGVRIYAFYHPDEYTASTPLLMSDASNWNKGAQIAKHSIEHFSKNFGRYVYPQATVVSGPVVGMEYPMMIFAESGDAVINTLGYTIVHELGHEWFPMMVGSNETNYPFMDEGFDTYITSTAMEAQFGDNGMLKKEFVDKYSWMNPPSSNTRLFEQRFYLFSALEDNEAAIMSHPYLIPSNQYGIMAYNKPGSVLVMLEDLMGKEKFSQAMNEYFSRWVYKHPYPADFFNTMEDAAGRDLDWFWNQWFDQTWKLDMSVNDVKNEASNGQWHSTITLENEEQAVMPATLRLILADGTSRDIRFSETIWSKGPIAAIVVDSLPAKVTNVMIDPELRLSDVDRLNNSWCMPPVVFDYGLNIANYFLYPLDAYRINAAPVVGFNLRDGFELGTNITGSSMAADHNVSLQTKYGIHSDVPDYELSYSTPIRMWDPKLTTSAKVFRLDGFSGWQWTFEKSFDHRKNLARSYRRSFVINTSILSIRVNDDRYLANRAEWNTAGHLDAGFITLKYYENYSWGKFTVRLQDEFGTPTSSFSYSKLTAETKFDYSFLGLKAAWRFFGGSSTGAVPVQTAHSLTQSSTLERFDSWFTRTPIVGASLRDNLTKSGGGNLFLQHDTIAANVAAMNFSLLSGPLVLFADAGTLWDSSSARFKQFYYDAGIGLQVNLGNIMLPGYSSGPIGFGLYFPIYINDPGRPNDNEMAYRWRVVIGVRL
ncbi:MAG: M1 family metallopeptidase [Bacteriovoracaceae bacterium]|nr:M1 family metallopeptidase [Bacteroidota bacterium]